MMQSATPSMKSSHLHGLASLYFEDGQIERSLLLLMLANLILPGDPKILRSLAAVTLAYGAVERSLKIIALLGKLGETETPELAILRKRAAWLASVSRQDASMPDKFVEQ